MPQNPEQVAIYHITDVANLPGIIAENALLSDAQMAQRNPAVVIGYDHIKLRRMKEIRVGCCGDHFVGEFTPFYYCPRSPMLYTINRGNTGRPEGCQRTIVHLVSTMAAGIATGRAWAVSSGNAGACHTTYNSTVDALDELDWQAIRATDWKGRQHQKAAEFLVADAFPWNGVHRIGCQNPQTLQMVQGILAGAEHQPALELRPEWYY